MPYAVPVVLKEKLWPLSVTYTHCDQSQIWVLFEINLIFGMMDYHVTWESYLISLDPVYLCPPGVCVCLFA
jgi:hypothetical protein